VKILRCGVGCIGESYRTNLLALGHEEIVLDNSSRNEMFLLEIKDFLNAIVNNRA
jgi:hypothetical protein